MKRTFVAAAVALAVAGSAAAGVQAFTLPSWWHRTQTVSAQPGAQPAPVHQPLPPAAVPNYRAIVQAEGPGVVGVTVAGMHQASDEDGPGVEQDPYLRFFRGVPGLRIPPRAAPFRGQGSGFIVSADGLVLTNAHVVRDAATDVAVLRIEAKGLPTVHLGDARTVQVGDYVLAIGAPYGLEQTATQGIVSAKGRSLPGDGTVPFIQTDAAVNPGNSGGPLFDAGGRVIGINAQIFSSSGGFQGLAFAIPIDVALRVKDEIVAHGRVDHARLGVTLQDLSAPLAESFGMTSPDGALVASVLPGSAADKAGLRPGDVITGLDGAVVHVAGDVSTRVGGARPGDRLTLQVWRDRSRRDLPLVLGRADPERAPATASADGPGLGLGVRSLDRDELRRAGLDHGLLIEQATGPAQQAGVAPGDVLLALNGKPVRGIEQVREALRGHPRHVALLILRDGQQIFVPVDLG